MSGSHDKAGISAGGQLMLGAHAHSAPKRTAVTLPVTPQEAGLRTSSGPDISQQRQPTRGQRPQHPLPSPSTPGVGGLTDEGFRQPPAGYGGHQQAYPWFQQQQSFPFPQGQMPPYGWLPYSVGYQIYGDQHSGPSYYHQEDQSLPIPPYQLMYAGGHPELPGYRVAGAGQGFRLPLLGGPFFPSALQPPMTRGRPPRGMKPSEEVADTYEFDTIEAHEQPGRARKTLMLRNIPNKYTIHMLLEMLDKCHKKPPAELAYDFCYLPIDFKNRCNLGYAFVNFVDAASTIECFNAFNAKRWNDFNSKKVCEVKYARVQGRDALIEHFRNSKFPSNDVDCLPLLFEKVTLDSGEQAVRSVPLHSRQVA